MSGFIADLLSRARGEAITIRPRVRSRYEPTESIEAQGLSFGEIHEERALDPRSANRRAVESLSENRPAPAAMPAAGEPAPLLSGTSPHANGGPAVPPPQAMPEMARGRAKGFLAPPRPAAAPVALPSEPVSAPPSPDPVIVREAAPPASHDAPSRDVKLDQPAQFSPAVRRTPPPSPEPRERQVAATVHVTIGRIEIRAETGAPARAPAAKSPQVMSLDDYLRSRREGAR